MPDRFPAADPIRVVDSFDSLGIYRFPVDERSYIVIVTRGHAHDRDVLPRRFTPGAPPRHDRQARKVKETPGLRDRGFGDDDIARVHAPIGVAIGAETPEEIAISIAAQLIQVRHELAT